MSSALPEPIDTSHLAPCSRCGTLNGLSARWCWRCDAALTADSPPLPRTVPSVVFDPPFDGDALAMPMPPDRSEPQDDDGVIPRLGRRRSLAFAPTEPPVLSEAIVPLSTPPAGPSQPLAPPAETLPTSRRRYGIAALAGVALVAVGVVGYVQMHGARLADLDRLPPPSAGPVAAPAAARSNAAPVATAAPRAPSPAPGNASPAGPASELLGPRSPPRPPPAQAAARDRNIATAHPVRAAAPRPAPRVPALNRTTSAPLAPVRIEAPAPARPAMPVLPGEAPPIPGPCTANAAALGLCSAASN